MKDAGIRKKPILPKVAEIIEANSMFEAAVLSGTLCHSDQPSLEQIAANVEHRAIGNNGGFGYVSILEGADVSLLDAVLLAHWICATTKVEKKKQRVSC
jgi:phage terminase large subunit-like protein